MTLLLNFIGLNGLGYGWVLGVVRLGDDAAGRLKRLDEVVVHMLECI